MSGLKKIEPQPMPRYMWDKRYRVCKKILESNKLIRVIGDSLKKQREKP